jgi:hypothetical protein
MTDKVRKLSDVLPQDKFYPEAERVDWKELQGKEIHILEAIVIDDFTSDFGSHPLALLRLENPESDAVLTTACSGRAVVNQVKKLMKLRNGFPVAATVTKTDGPNAYWLLK